MNDITTGKESASKSSLRSLWAGLTRLLRGGLARAAAAARRCLARLRDLAGGRAAEARRAVGIVLDAAGLDLPPAVDQFPGNWGLVLVLVPVLTRLWQAAAAARGRRRARAGRARAEGGDVVCSGACEAPAGRRMEACPGREGCHRSGVISARAKGGPLMASTCPPDVANMPSRCRPPAGLGAADNAAARCPRPCSRGRIVEVGLMTKPQPARTFRRAVNKRASGRGSGR